MQVLALADIVEGKLLNSPAISFITKIDINLKKLSDGGAFFAKNQDEIEEAIKKGAFAIIVDFDPIITDEEIAWIKVDDFDKAIANVLRYKLFHYKIKFIKVDVVLFYFLNIFSNKTLSNIIILQNDINIDFELLNKLESDKIVFGTDIKFLNAISADVEILKPYKYDIKNLIVHSLFETSFSYKDRYFDRVRLPQIYIDSFIQFLEIFEYNIDLKKLNNFKLFRPLFVNKTAKVVPFGQTNRFILANSDKIIADIEIQYLQTSYKYGKILIIDAVNKPLDDIFNIIKSEEFNALYLLGIDISDVLDLLVYKDNEVGLI